MKFSFSDTYTQGILIAVIAALIVISIKSIRKRILVILKSIFQRRAILIDHYEKEMDANLFSFSHPWMNENRVVDDILIPVSIISNRTSESITLEKYINSVFRTNKYPKIMIIGEPGCGKSIALALITRFIWMFSEEGMYYIPLFLRFIDIRTIKNSDDLIEVIIEKFKYYQIIKNNQVKNDIIGVYVNKLIQNNNLLLIIDGFDELSKEQRSGVSYVLEQFLGTYNTIPVIFSSRNAVYLKEKPFSSILDRVAQIAPLRPEDIHKFINKWDYSNGKSAYELFKIIISSKRSKLIDLAKNPLMLTIITYLYNLPKYILPDNRVEFYSQCTKALLDEWDISKSTLRNNRYETYQKYSVLSSIAYNNINEINNSDELIDEEIVYNTIRKQMFKLGLRKEDFIRMKDEIVQNSGLLHSVPPKYLRFPHRTFFEFFSAKYIDDELSPEVLIALFKSDPAKWREVLLLYIGLTEKVQNISAIFDFLLLYFDETQDEILLTALRDCSRPTPEIAGKVLTKIDNYFLQNPSSEEFVNELGYIANNSKWSHSLNATEILKKLLNQKISSELLQNILILLVKQNDPKVEEIIVENIAGLNISEFFSFSSEKQKEFAIYLFRMEIGIDKKQAVINGITRSSQFDLLAHLLIEDIDDKIKEYIAVMFFLKVKKQTDWLIVENNPVKIYNPFILDLISANKDLIDFRWSPPNTLYGKSIALIVSHFYPLRAERGEYDVLKNSKNNLISVLSTIVKSRKSKSSWKLFELNQTRISKAKIVNIYSLTKFVTKGFGKVTFFKSILSFVLIGCFLFSFVANILFEAFYLEETRSFFEFSLLSIVLYAVSITIFISWEVRGYKNQLRKPYWLLLFLISFSVYILFSFTEVEIYILLFQATVITLLGLDSILLFPNLINYSNQNKLEEEIEYDNT